MRPHRHPFVGVVEETGGWRWQISHPDGRVLWEGSQHYTSGMAATAAGARQLRAMNRPAGDHLDLETAF